MIEDLISPEAIILFGEIRSLSAEKNTFGKAIKMVGLSNYSNQNIEEIIEKLDTEIEFAKLFLENSQYTESKQILTKIIMYGKHVLDYTKVCNHALETASQINDSTSVQESIIISKERLASNIHTYKSRIEQSLYPLMTKFEYLEADVKIERYLEQKRLRESSE